jgi:hypothetical protein
MILQPGVYSILVRWNSDRDQCGISMPGNGTDVVQATAAITGLLSSATRPGITSVSSVDLLAVTFRFTVIPKPPPPPLMVATEFVDCEAVACAGLPTGEYSVQGRRTFCDNDEAGGGWTRIWRLNDSSCESNGWTSGRNIHATGVDPVGCRSGKSICSPSKNITSSNHSFAEVMGKNWEIWAFGSLDSFASDDGVFVTADRSRLWTFSISFPSATSRASRCPCDPLFSSAGSTGSAALQRINDTGGDYFCDVAESNITFSPVFQGMGPNLCSPKGRGRRSFQKVLTEQQRQWALGVLVCKSQSDSNEDVKLGALDLYARRTASFDRAKCSTTTTTTMPRSSTSANGTSRGDSDSAVDRSKANVATIAGAVGGAIGGLLLVSAIVALIARRRRAEKTSESATTAASASASTQSEYASSLRMLG